MCSLSFLGKNTPYKCGMWRGGILTKRLPRPLFGTFSPQSKAYNIGSITICWYKKLFTKKNRIRRSTLQEGGGVKGKVDPGSLFRTFFFEPFP